MITALANPGAVKARLQAAGLWSKKQLGQHFLCDETVLAAIVEAGGVTKSDTVVEVGPGMGVMSRLLLPLARRVVAFEYDPDMVRLLDLDVPELEVVAGDFLRTAPAVLPGLGEYKVVANIPYQITTPLLRLFVEGPDKPSLLVLLVQKEVGQRLTAPAKGSGRGYLSVLCEYFAVPEYLLTVPPTAFYPPPSVDSAVIRLVLKKERLFEGDEERAFLKFVHALFIQPRKQLKNVIAGIRGTTSAEVETQLVALGLSSMVRAQELNLDEWVVLYKELGGRNE